MIAYFATDPSGTSRIWIRAMDSIETAPLNGTESTADTRPIWSPDSRNIAFFAEGKLKRVSVDGGPAQTVCDANGADGTWSTRGDVVRRRRQLHPDRPRRRRHPEDLLAPDPDTGTASVEWPEFLPDGRLLYLKTTEDGESRLMSGRIDSDETSEIMLVDSRVQYVDPGFLLYIRDETLVAQPFDADSGKLAGDPRPIADQRGSCEHRPRTVHRITAGHPGVSDGRRWRAEAAVARPVRPRAGILG